MTPALTQISIAYTSESTFCVDPRELDHDQNIEWGRRDGIRSGGSHGSRNKRRLVRLISRVAFPTRVATSHFRRPRRVGGFYVAL